MSAPVGTVTFSARPVRYVRDWLQGSTVNSGDHWVEIEVWGQHPGETSLFVGEHAEWRAGSLVKYYHTGGQRVALRTSSGLYYLLSDHLGSTSVTLQATGTTLTKVGELRYKPWGESRPMRYAESATPTDYRYTGQRAESESGLYHYGSRWYDPALGRFLSPDTVVPDPYNPLDWNRFGYARNNPVKYIDPDGHRVVDPDGYDGTHAGLAEKRLANNPKFLNTYSMPTCMKPPVDPRHSRSVKTNPIHLDGGPGTKSYGAAADEGWTGFAGSGESSDPRISGAVGSIGLLSDIAVWIRDNTNIWGNGGEVSGTVYYQLLDIGGYTVTGVSITNSSYETIGVSSVWLEIYNFDTNNKVSSERLYPYPHTSIVPLNYGIAQPGSYSSIVNLSPRLVPNYNYVDVSIWVASSSGRWGVLSTSFAVNPPTP